MSSRIARILVLQCSTFLAACSGSETACALDSECASNFCRADGTCAPVGDVDAGVDGPTDGPNGLCTPNHDGSVTLGELPLVAGKMANFRIATDVTFATAGTANGDGTRTWNLDVQLSGDADRPLALGAPTGQWWEASFPTASYAAPLSSGSDLLGVFHTDDAALTLLGVVSPDAGTFRTELEYDPPAKILALPFQAGSTWTSTSTVSGTAQGVITAYTEEYTALVDQVGTMTTPYGEFPVLRVATDLERTAGLATLATTRTFAWMAECFGSVANATSQDFESGSEFDDPAEVRRLAP